jgi:hypothetical protein
VHGEQSDGSPWEGRGSTSYGGSVLGEQFGEEFQKLPNENPGIMDHTRGKTDAKQAVRWARDERCGRGPINCFPSDSDI